MLSHSGPFFLFGLEVVGRVEAVVLVGLLLNRAQATEDARVEALIAAHGLALGRLGSHALFGLHHRGPARFCGGEDGVVVAPGGEKPGVFLGEDFSGGGHNQALPVGCGISGVQATSTANTGAGGIGVGWSEDAWLYAFDVIYANQSHAFVPTEINIFDLDHAKVVVDPSDAAFTGTIRVKVFYQY